jgi:hypothetical protein
MFSSPGSRYKPSRKSTTGGILRVSSLAYSSTLKMEAVCSSETSGVTTRKTVLFIVVPVRTSNPTKGTRFEDIGYD